MPLTNFSRRKQMNKKFYITTPIYYPSNKLTIGNSYTTVVCDAIARFHRMLGYDVFFLTGTDEHGQKIAKVAKEKGVSEMEHLNSIVADTKNLWKSLNISYDRFIRTTDPDHVSSVKKIFNKLYEKGEIYKTRYTGKYCVPCESFWSDGQLVNGKCPDCGRDVIDSDEECYNFRLSKYTEKINELYAKNPSFLQPQNRVNEMVNNFLSEGLKDLCVSRKSVKWGIPVDFDQDHTIYVWIDALSNYITALGYMSDDDSLFKKFWPADVHVVGKEIVRFHAIIWPAILMALDLPLPKEIFGHGWLLFNNDKLSKSKETGKKEVIDPRILIENYGSDSIRNFLIGEINFGNDGPYSQESFLLSFNTNLANTIGNVASRTLGMLEKYTNGIIPAINFLSNIDSEFKEKVVDLKKKCIDEMIALHPTQSYKAALEILESCNRYIDDTKPWELAKEGKTAEVETFLNLLANAQLEAYVLLLPFLPEKLPLVFEKFGTNIPKNIDENNSFNLLKAGIKVEKGENLFNRLDIKKELEKLNLIANS